MSKMHYCARCLTTFPEDNDACPNLACGKGRPEKGWGIVLGAGEMLDRHYQIIRALAVGGAGMTYLAREIDADGKPTPPDLAIKVLYTARASGPFLRRLANEAQILQELAHENIVQCKGFVHRSGQEPYLVTLFEHGGALTDHIEKVGSVPPKIAAGITRQILLALDVAHQRGVVHRDLKPDNVLLHKEVAREVMPLCRVTDFGIAKVSGGLNTQLTRLGAFIGTPEYAAPEQFQALPPTPATDVFAAGGVLHYLLTGRPAVTFTHRGDITQDYEELLEQIPPRLEVGDHDPNEIRILQVCIDSMMAERPEDRWTVSQILSALSAILEGTKILPATLEATLQGTDRPAMPRKRAPADFPVDDLTDEVEETTVDVSGNIKVPKASGASSGSPTGTAPVSPPPTPPTPQTPPTPLPTPPTPQTGEMSATMDHHLDSEAPPRRGFMGFFLGLGVAGMAGLAVVGGGAVIVVLLGGAYVMGYFGGGPSVGSEPDPLVIDVVEGKGKKGKKAKSKAKAKYVEIMGSEEHQKERRQLTRALRREAGGLASTCGATGPVALDVVLSASGTITDVSVDAGYLPPAKTECVASALRDKELPRTSRKTARLRAAIYLK